MPSLGVERTTLSLDALGRFVCGTYDEALSPEVPSGTPSELAAIAEDVAPFDAIVIGSGMYGAYAATRLYRMGQRVLVLEAGPFLISEHYQNLSVPGFSAGENILALDSVPGINNTQGLVWGQPWRGEQIFRRLAFCVGGKSLFWGGWAPRLTDDVLDNKLVAAGATWPAETVAYLRDRGLGYERTERDLGVRELVPDSGNPGGPRKLELSTDFFNSTSNPLNKAIFDRRSAICATYKVEHGGGVTTNSTIEAVEPAPIAVQATPPSSGLFSFDKFSSIAPFEEAIREDIDLSGLVDQRRRLFVVPNAKVVRLATVPAGNKFRVSNIELLGLPSIPVSDKTQVILALSCIESTRLAQDSFRDVHPLSNLMGRNLMAHIRNNVTLRIRRSALGLSPSDNLETAAFHVVGRSPTGGRYHFQFYAGYLPSRDGDAVLYRMATDADVQDSLQRNQDPEWVSLTFRACGEMVGRTDVPTGDPRASYVNLSTSIDSFGNRPRAWVHLTQQPADLSVFDEMDQVIFRVARALVDSTKGDAATDVEVWAPDGSPNPWKTLDKNPFDFDEDRYGKLAQGEGGIRDGLGTTWHECGTLWLGDDSASSVLNPKAQFHQVVNAWCVDQSAFPRCGSANPVPTGLTIARMAAEAIADDGLKLISKRVGGVAGGPIETFFHDPNEAGFEPLFVFESGKDLPRGWQHFGRGKFNRFGATLETNGGLGVLCYTTKVFADFTVKLQYRSLTLQNNSGVYVRLPSVLNDDDVQEPRSWKANDSFALATRFRSTTPETAMSLELPSSFSTAFTRPARSIRYTQ